MTKSHGHTKKREVTRTYRAWSNMKTRCGNPKATQYAYYGGRGISVCEEWQTFENFLADMGESPEGMSLDRIDSNGDYAKNNCRWASMETQQNNKRSNRVLIYKGDQLTLSQLAQNAGINVGSLWDRLEVGMTVEDAVNTPLRNTLPCAHGELAGCHKCKLERDDIRRRKNGIPERSPPACPKGHLFTPETTKLNNGWRVCRICAREYMRAYSAKKRVQNADTGNETSLGQP